MQAVKEGNKRGEGGTENKREKGGGRDRER